MYVEDRTDLDAIEQLKEHYFFILKYSEGIESYEILYKVILTKKTMISVKFIGGDGREYIDDIEVVLYNGQWKIVLPIS